MGFKRIYLSGGKRRLRCRWFLSFALLGRALAGTLDMGNGNVEVEKHNCVTPVTRNKEFQSYLIVNPA